MSQLEHFGATETTGSVITRIAQQQGHQHTAKNHRRTDQMAKRQWCWLQWKEFYSQFSKNPFFSVPFENSSD